MRTRPAPSPSPTIPPPSPAVAMEPGSVPRMPLLPSPPAPPIRCRPAPPPTRRAPIPRRPAPRRPMRTRVPPALVRSSTTSPCPSRDARSRARPVPTIRRSWPNRSTARRSQSRTSPGSTPIRPSPRGGPSSRTPTAVPCPTPTGTWTTRGSRCTASGRGTTGTGAIGAATPRTACGPETAVARRQYGRPTPAGPNSPRRTEASSTTFSDDPRQLLYQVEYEGTRYSKKKGKHIDRFRGANPPNTIDRAHAAHYVPRPKWLGDDTRDRIRPALAGVERVPVLAPRANRELAAEG